MESGCIRVGGMCGMIAYAAYEAAAFHYYIDVGRHKEFDAAAEGMDVYLLVLSNHGLAQVHADAAAKGIKTGTVERLTVIDILIAAVFYSTTDALAILADGQGALQPLVGVSAIAVYNHQCT